MWVSPWRADVGGQCPWRKDKVSKVELVYWGLKWQEKGERSYWWSSWRRYAGWGLMEEAQRCHDWVCTQDKEKSLQRVK